MGKNICIIPARGGSKRIPRKNIKKFLGKPIIAYSIEIALKSELFDEVMVSTDDAEIAEIAKKYGATVPFFRSQEKANDLATLNDVLEEVVDFYKQKLDKTFDFGCCLLPTSPLLKSEFLIQGLKELKDKKFDSLRPITEFSYPPQRGFLMDSDSGLVQFANPEYALTRSQDLEKIYHDAGQFYMFKIPGLLKGEKRGAIVIPNSIVQDIDTEEDWVLAEMKYEFLTLKGISGDI
jgi:pseudaminic acid cytidylyltransferase